MAEYLVTAIWWPDGWEPITPLDVPKCLAHARKEAACHWMSYEQAVATVRSLNRQNMDHPGATWHVVATVKGEAAVGEETIDADRLEVVTPAADGGRGDCSHCPAEHLPCNIDMRG